MSCLESIALKATIVLPHLLQQKPHKTSKSKDHAACLDRRMAIWKHGDIDELVEEGRAIQNRLPKQQNSTTEKNTARSFANQMFAEKCKAALDLLSNNERGTLLHLNDPSDPQASRTNVTDYQRSSNHQTPSSKKVYEECILTGEPEASLKQSSLD